MAGIHEPLMIKCFLAIFFPVQMLLHSSKKLWDPKYVFPIDEMFG